MGQIQNSINQALTLGAGLSALSGKTQKRALEKDLEKNVKGFAKLAEEENWKRTLWQGDSSELKRSQDMVKTYSNKIKGAYSDLFDLTGNPKYLGDKMINDLLSRIDKMAGERMRQKDVVNNVRKKLGGV